MADIVVKPINTQINQVPRTLSASNMLVWK